MMFGSLLELHTNWAYVVMISNGLAGVWCLAAHKVPGLRLRAMWWFVIAAEISIFVQVAMGVAMVAAQHIDAPQFHMFYGFVAIITVALLYAYRQQLRPHMYLLYGFGGLFLMGLGIRAVLVGS